VTRRRAVLGVIVLLAGVAFAGAWHIFAEAGLLQNVGVSGPDGPPPGWLHRLVHGRHYVMFGLSDEMLARERLDVNPAPWEDGLRADTGPGCFEWWYFDAHLDDGSTAVIVFLTKPAAQREGPLNPHVQVRVTRPDGHLIEHTLFYAPDQFSAARDTCAVRIGPNWVRGDLDRYQLHIEAEDVAGALTFDGEVPAWRPGTGKNFYDPDLSRYFGWLAAVPFGRVAGTLTYEGETHRVRGTGYHDHNWGNVTPNVVMSQWYWGRAHVGEFTLIFVEIASSAQYGYERIPIFMLAKGDTLITGDGRPLTLDARDFVTHDGGRAYPQELDLRWEGDTGSIRISLRNPTLIEATDLLEGVPAWQRVLAGLFMTPYYFRFDSELTLSVDLEDITAEAHGRCLYEQMLLD